MTYQQETHQILTFGNLEPNVWHFCFKNYSIITIAAHFLSTNRFIFAALHNISAWHMVIWSLTPLASELCPSLRWRHSPTPEITRLRGPILWSHELVLEQRGSEPTLPLHRNTHRREITRLMMLWKPPLCWSSGGYCDHRQRGGEGTGGPALVNVYVCWGVSQQPDTQRQVLVLRDGRGWCWAGE